MRYLILFILLLPAFRGHAQAGISPKDSLLRALSETSIQQQVKIYRDLADLTYDTPEEPGYLKLLYEKALQSGQTEMVLEALTDIVPAYALLEQPDSARYYFSLVERLAPRENRDQWTCYLSMFLYNFDMLAGGKGKAIADRLKEYQARNGREGTLYKQVEDAYILGVSFLNRYKYEEAVPYLTTAVELVRKLPFKEGFRYQVQVMRRLAYACAATKRNSQSVALLEEVLRMQERYADRYYKDSRPFYPLNERYIPIYSSILLNMDVMPEKQTEYYLGLLEGLCKDSDNPAYKYTYFLSRNNYYQVREDWENALVYNDSLIKYAYRIAPYNLPGLYGTNSMICEKIGDYPKAFEYLKKSNHLRDSTDAQDQQQMLSELQVEYGMDKLAYENAQLEIRNKRLMVIGLLVLLALVVLLCVYLYAHLRKERRMKEEMGRLKLQAEESEKMKTAFINSMCHEIRTPLNAIVGFSDLLLDESLDGETRQSFPKEIRDNASLLTSLINNMLEVSTLDVSEEKLPLKPADVSELCRMAVAHLAAQDIPGVECRADLPGEPLVVPTHARYLSLVLENLLDNAAKFTGQGNIILGCRKEGDNLVLDVTDTGCGIPSEKHKEVFGRFTKLDTFSKGNGLGLYICQLVVKRLSGEIFIDPDYTEGTRIVVVLPTE